MKGLEDQLARLRQAQAASGQQAAALRERLRRLQNADARGRVYLQTSAGEVRNLQDSGPSDVCRRNNPQRWMLEGLYRFLCGLAIVLSARTSAAHEIAKAACA